MSASTQWVPPVARNDSPYPNRFFMLNIIATVIRVTVLAYAATAERCVGVHLLKMYFCAALKEERLTGLELLAIHKDLHFQNASTRSSISITLSMSSAKVCLTRF